MSTSIVIYDGPHDAVEVPAADHIVAERGKPVELDADVAAALLEQGCWKAPKAPAPTAKKGDN